MNLHAHLAVEFSLEPLQLSLLQLALSSHVGLPRLLKDLRARMRTCKQCRESTNAELLQMLRVLDGVETRALQLQLAILLFNAGKN